MRWWLSLSRRIRSIIGRNAAEQSLNEELRFHIDRQIEQNIAAGMEPDEARRAAQREFGGASQIQEECRDAWGVRFIDEITGDLRYALRSLIHGRGLSAAVVVTLALGIGANAAIFSLIDAVLLRSLAVQSPEELFVPVIRDGERRSTNFSYPMFKDLEESVGDEALLFAVRGSDLEVRFLSGSGERSPERVRVEMISGQFFPALGVGPGLGRVLTPDDDRKRGQHPVAVISHRFWRARFGGDPAAVGGEFVLNGTVFTIVGVSPPTFYGAFPGSVPDVWVPVTMQERMAAGRPLLDSYNTYWLGLMGRRKPGVTESSVLTRMNLRFSRVQETLAQTRTRPESRQRMLRETLELEPGKAGFDSLRQRYSQALQILMVVAALILLIACANVANLLLARSTARANDATIRLALGAPRSRLVRQSLVESFLLAMLSAAAAVGLAAFGSRSLLAAASSGRLYLDLDLNWRLVLFSLGVAAVTVMIFGLAPALQTSRADVSGSLRSVGRRATDGRSGRALRSTLAVVQLTIAVALVVCAGLFLRTITNLHSTEVGFDRANVLMVRMSAADAGYGLARGTDVSDTEREAAKARLLGLLTRLIDRLESLPGVRSVTKSECGFLTGCRSGNRSLVVDGQRTESEDVFPSEHVWPSYVRTMGMTLLAGRGLSERDGANAPHVALINETMARTYFGDVSGAVGMTFRFENETQQTRVVGVIQDVNHQGPRSEVLPYIYYPHAQRPSDLVALTIRTSAPAESLAQPVREAIADVESSLNVLTMTALERQFDIVIRTELLLARLTAAFGLLALALTCVGLYGLLAYSVARRTNEIGLRMALGAQQWAIVRGVLRQTLALVSAGVAAGLLLALGATRLLESQLYGVAPNDPVTIAATVGIVILVALLAAGRPARRAARIEPMQALRHD